ncbi:membrane protein [Alkalihalobacillus alcalophilus ATCC 27647 = CGMCC 1.3604]|uniref:Membrane protein n=1 Tax=Alkalihalobacillus alcalophilus ATCC 27647 = CGMCC 1.3604 TaxID=1218173 RepID=A0A094YZL7_ALKAL|nr:trimeric intracellular cation channel family protein [Alkalihalobacillus alcalophilus]KGA99012.1 membrane protein [Alkalihalobacillus alcalophilus ATCC 27647 = CGMCC 1.3604]MED1560650.1 trimeric intracellular cation channel family protein [Alkalihalobacillus alcalophilus]THG89667.1 membrane protein [Alkalihalobacillus alcalophilus ATCC 27647 = CGMCC 1.3604]
MVWETLNIIGTIAFAISGAIVAIEEKYDILGVLVLGFVTAFGGGAIRNLLIGAPVSLLWDQALLFSLALVTIIIVFLLKDVWINYLKRVIIFDAMGLAAFAIQGAMLANENGLPLVAVATAAVLTGSGGGMVRDVLAGRKPVIFRDEIYALWAMLAGLVIGLGLITAPFMFYTLFVIIVVLRMLSVRFNWTLPKYSDVQKIYK